MAKTEEPTTEEPSEEGKNLTREYLANLRTVDF